MIPTIFVKLLVMEMFITRAFDVPTVKGMTTVVYILYILIHKLPYKWEQVVKSGNYAID